MIFNGKIIYLAVILIFVSSCEEDKILFYQGQYFRANQELKLSINDEEYVYEKKFAEDYNRDNYLLIKKFKAQTDSVKVYLKIDNRDTTITFPASTKKVVFGTDAYKNPFMFTEKDTGAWISD